MRSVTPKWTGMIDLFWEPSCLVAVFQQKGHILHPTIRLHLSGCNNWSQSHVASWHKHQMITASTPWWDGKRPSECLLSCAPRAHKLYITSPLCKDIFMHYFTRMQYFKLLSQPPKHQKKYDYTGSRKQELANKISSSLWVRHSSQGCRVSCCRSERNTALQGQSISGCPTSGFKMDWCYVLY